MKKFYLFISILLGLISSSVHAQNCQAYFVSSISPTTTVSFIDSSWTSTGNLFYSWNFGDGDTSTLSNPVHIYNQNGTYVVCLSITSSLGCQDSYCDTIQVGGIINPPCSASFYYTTDTSNTAYFSSQVTGTSPYTYNWNFGDGSANSTLANPVHVYNSAGAYGVTLNVSSANGVTCMSYDTVFINTCDAFFITSAVSNGTVNFNNYSNAPPQTIYTWNFGDGSPTVQQQNTSHTYNASGTYFITLTSFDSLSLCSDSYQDSIQITLAQNCQAGFTYNKINGQVNFQSTASNFQTISYDFGDGGMSFTANPSYSYAQSGSYLVCQTVVDSLSNCTSTFCDTILINIPPPCQAGFTYAVNQGNISITNTSTNSSLISYNFGDGGTSTNANPSYTYMQSGIYTICQTVSNNLGCSDSTCFTVNITIDPPCVANFAYTLSQDSVSLVDLSSNADSVFYNYGDGTISANNTHIYTQSGTYTICQTVLGSNACSDTYCDSVTVSIPNCIAGFSHTQVGDSVHFTSSASNYTSINYDFGDGFNSSAENPIHLYLNSGTFIVKQTVTNINRGCIDEFIDTIHINISNSCVANFLIAIDTNNTGTLFIVNTSTNDPTHQYSWTFGDGNVGSGRLPTHFYQNNQAHEICLTITDTVMNCTSTFCDTVGLDSNGQILKSRGYKLRVLEGDFIGIDERNNELEKVNIYPNPFTNELNIELSANSPIQYELYTLTGKTIKSGVLLNQQIKLPDIESGIYFIRLVDGNNSITKKIIKQNF